jgi:hypothetical protein
MRFDVMGTTSPGLGREELGGGCYHESAHSA